MPSLKALPSAEATAQTIFQQKTLSQQQQDGRCVTENRHRPHSKDVPCPRISPGWWSPPRPPLPNCPTDTPHLSSVTRQGGRIAALFWGAG